MRAIPTTGPTTAPAINPALLFFLGVGSGTSVAPRSVDDEVVVIIGGDVEGVDTTENTISIYMPKMKKTFIPGLDGGVDASGFTR